MNAAPRKPVEFVERTPERCFAPIFVQAIAVASTVAVVGVPLAMLVFSAFRGPADFLPFEEGASFTLDNLRQIFGGSLLLTQVMPQTLAFVAGVVCLTCTLAFGLAWLTERTDLPARNVWFTVIVAPLLVPTPIFAIAWIILFGPNAGWANQFLQSVFGSSAAGTLNVFSMPGLIICQSIASTPFVYLQFTATLRGMAGVLEEAAAMSGAGAWTTFRRITFPILLPGLLAPAILVALVTFEQFELPLIIGLPANINIFAYRVYTELNPSSGLPNYGAACAISLPFLALGLTALAFYMRATRHAQRFVTVTGKASAPRRLALGHYRWPVLAALLMFVLLAAALPFTTLVWTSLFGFAPPGQAAMSVSGLSVYRSFLSAPEFWHALGNTIFVALCSALMISGLGGLIAFLATRFPSRTTAALDLLSFMSLGIPSVIAALAVMVLYLTVPSGIYGTIWILVIAYSYRLATATRLSKAGLLQISRELEEAAQMAGAGRLLAHRRILLPLLRPTLVSSFVIALILGLREFTIPFMLAGSDNVVLPVLVWQLFQNGQPTASAALATITIIMLMPLIWIIARLR